MSIIFKKTAKLHCIKGQNKILLGKGGVYMYSVVIETRLAPSSRKEISCHFFSATERKHLNTMRVNCFDHFTLYFHEYHSHILPIQ